MERKLVLISVIVILFVSLFGVGFRVGKVQASGTIYIRADGSIEGATDISTFDNVTYTFTDDIIGVDGIVVERSNITIDGNGYSLQCLGVYGGFSLTEMHNVTIKNTDVTAEVNAGIRLEDCSNSIISSNNITGGTGGPGVDLYNSSVNDISGNKITDGWGGIGLWDSTNNSILENIILKNEYGIILISSTDNNILGNTISRSEYGLSLLFSSGNNRFHHNNFVDNAIQVDLMFFSGRNVWDDSYPSGGNYWGDYAGVDLYSGPYQNETGSDGIGDTPYVIDEDNKDNYPLIKPNLGITTVATSKTIVGRGYSLQINVTIFNYGLSDETFNVTMHINTTFIETRHNMTLASRNCTTITLPWNTTDWARGNYTIQAYVWPIPSEATITDNILISGLVFVTIPGDVDGNRDVDIFDIVAIAGAYGSEEGDPAYNPNFDIDGDGDVDIFDIVAAARHYGENW